jgi:hypothetical protein
VSKCNCSSQKPLPTTGIRTRDLWFCSLDLRPLDQPAVKLINSNSYDIIDFNFNIINSSLNYYSTLFAFCVKDFTRPELPAVECAGLMSESLEYCADVVLGRGPISKGTRCNWWNYGLVKRRREFRRGMRKINFLQSNIRNDLKRAACVSRVHYRGEL